VTQTEASWEWEDPTDVQNTNQMFVINVFEKAKQISSQILEFFISVLMEKDF
jgi:hypothetical protein